MFVPSRSLDRELTREQTGWIHALVATPLSLLLLLRPSPAVVLDPIFAYAPTEGAVFALSAGYFYYDLVVSLWHVKSHGPAFVLHALSCCFIFTAVWRPLLMGIGSRFLIVRPAPSLERPKC